MSVMVLGVMIFGVYLVPLSESTGAGLVATSLYMTIYGWVMAAAAVVYGFLYSKFGATNGGFRILNIVVILLGAASPLWNGTVAPSFGIVGYYIGAGINGISGGCFMAMVPLMMITEWFGPKLRGRFMGIASAAAMIGATIWPPLFTSILQTSGLNATYIANAAVLLVCTAIATAIFRRRDPDVLPWGVKSWEELEEQSGADSQKYGVPPKKIWTTPAFYLVVIATICFTLHGSMAQNLVGAVTFWLDDPINGPMIGALGMSVGSWGEALFKIISGFLIDRVGAAFNNAIFTCVAVAGLVIWVFAPHTIVFIFIGGALFGAATVPIILGGPMLMAQLFGPRTFPIVQGYVSAVNTALSGLTSPIFAMLIVSMGYTAALSIGAVVWIIPVITAVIIGIKYLGKLEWVDEDGNPMPKATGKIAA
jgi:MFS family permease